MNKLRKLTLAALLGAFPVISYAQSISALTVEVEAVTGVSTQGLTVELFGEESGWVFDPVKVNSQGTAKFSSVPDGVYTLTVYGSPLGLETYVDKNLQHSSSGPQTVKVVLNEAVRNPYALNATLDHDIFTGKDNLAVSWNRETDYFFDDFESYEPFAIEFAPWTGVDLDREPAVEMVGLYPNRGIQQYATIFNPLTIDPPVYYEYEVLRPFSGKQCVGFVRTRSGAANNDWLISPKIKVGVDNVVSFMAKASETQPDRFSVLVSTTGTDTKNFVSLTPGNYETVDYKGWKEITYSLAAYEGQEVYVAIHCVSQNSFMFMVDDFYVGPAQMPKKARRVRTNSATNPNEKFIVTFDGNKVGETEDTQIMIENVTAGSHTVGVQAKYVYAESETATLEVTVPGAEAYAALDVNLSTDIEYPLEGIAVNLLNTETAIPTDLKTDAQGKASVGFLPKGNYMVNVSTDVFEEYNASFDLEGAKTLDIALVEKITDPFNLIYEINDGEGETRDVELWWNQNLGYREGFEDYEDFTQDIGDWMVLDLDKMPTYAFSIGGEIIIKPESRGLVGAMVFNPYSTFPVQASDDAYFIAPEGNKYVMFNSAEMARSNDWLISPTQKIGRDYVMRFTAKSYQFEYPGEFEFVALKDKDIANPTLLDAFYLSPDWMRYEISLASYEGQNIEIGFHHTTYDGWLSFIDDVYIGPSDESIGDEVTDARCTFDVYLDNAFSRNVSEPYVKFEGLAEGSHKAGIQSIYPSGKKSNISEIEFTVDASGVVTIVDSAAASWRYFDLNGRQVAPEALLPGIYVRTDGNRSEKVVVK